VIAVAYEFFMLRLGGQTVGKMALGIRVVVVGGTMDGGGLRNDIAAKRAGVMWGPYIFQLIPIQLLASLLTMAAFLGNFLSQLWDKPLHQCLHDKVAGTVVVKTR
jgi:uncharacterized RDD family membrane protein YckC